MTTFEKVSEALSELWPAIASECNILGCKLVLTCSACPEQYDVFFMENGEEKQIGYLRLRHGRFYAQYTPTEEIVYVAHPDGVGIFNDNEREEHLTNAVRAILAKHSGIPEQMIVYLLNMETSDQYGISETVGVYSTRQLAKEASDKITDHRTFIKEMMLDAEPKE